MWPLIGTPSKTRQKGRGDHIPDRVIYHDQLQMQNVRVVHNLCDVNHPAEQIFIEFVKWWESNQNTSRDACIGTLRGSWQSGHPLGLAHIGLAAFAPSQMPAYHDSQFTTLKPPTRDPGNPGGSRAQETRDPASAQIPFVRLTHHPLHPLEAPQNGRLSRR